MRERWSLTEVAAALGLMAGDYYNPLGIALASFTVVRTGFFSSLFQDLVGRGRDTVLKVKRNPEH